MPQIKLTDPICLAILDRAMTQEFGTEIIVAPEQNRHIQNIFYRLKKAREPQYDSLMLCIPAGGDKIWFVKKSVEIE